jgi:hypothetical protein
MKPTLLLILALLLFQSCIPLRIAPKINDYTITTGKKFKRSLSKRQMFIFEDDKDADQFYNFVNTRFQLNDTNVYDDVPFEVNGKQYFFAWYEVEIPNKSIQILPILADVIVLSTGSHPMFIDAYGKREGNWYLAVEAYSDLEPDCMAEASLSREAVLKYLRGLKEEYLATNNYNETVFKN